MPPQQNSLPGSDHHTSGRGKLLIPPGINFLKIDHPQQNYEGGNYDRAYRPKYKIKTVNSIIFKGLLSPP